MKISYMNYKIMQKEEIPGLINLIYLLIILNNNLYHYLMLFLEISI
jgi:hypothetical protein